MKFEVMFLVAVLGIAGIHLLFNLVNFLTRFKRARVKGSRQESKRAGWYVFFETSALYGDMDNSAVTTEAVGENPVELAPACEGSCLPLEAQA
ncbi:MAG: hypothetical protein KAS94_05425 [Desulfobulbaceae bacterium]|nr:hypothetical protein [Desulfobulbaceae bacterium]